MNKSGVYMISRYGDVYEGIVRYGVQVHPNPGIEDDEYSEILNAVDWIFSVEKSDKGRGLCTAYLRAAITEYVKDHQDMSTSDLIDGIFDEVFNDDPKLYSSDFMNAIEVIVDELRGGDLPEYDDKYPLDLKRDIADYINQNYLRVRVGGKYDTPSIRTSSSGFEDAIYFRISSKGYDWRSLIIEFLWDYFGDQVYTSNTRVWVGHDSETNPPEKTLYDGPVSRLEEMDNRRFESKDEFVTKSPVRRRLYSRKDSYSDYPRELGGWV